MWKRQLILSIVWLAAVGWYWRGSVPLLPTRSAELKYDSMWVGWSPEGHAVVSGVELDVNRYFVKKFTGPVSFWRVPELEKLSEQLDSDDEIDTGTINAAYGLVVVGSGPNRRIVDVKSGVTLESVPQDVVKASFERRADSRVIYIRGDSVTLRDARLSKDIWTTTGLTGHVADFQHDLVLVYGGAKTGGSPGLLLLNAATGEIETRYEAIRPFDSLTISQDGRWALVQNSYGTYQICDARTANPLWTLKAKFENWPQFDTKRDELVLQWATPNGDYRESRWRCTDGAELSPPPEFFFWAHRTTDAAGRYAIDATSPRGSFQQFCSRYLNPALKAVGIRIQLPEERVFRVLRDLSTGKVIGPMPTDRHVQFAPGGSAAVAIGGRRIDVFEFPARRDWMWLVWWGVVPVSVAWGGRGLWWAFRRRFREAGPRQRSTGG